MLLATDAPAVLYWFELKRGPDHTADFIPHLIDNDSGVGTQITVADLNGDGRPDVISSNKKGFERFHPGEIAKVTNSDAALCLRVWARNYAAQDTARQVAGWRPAESTLEMTETNYSLDDARDVREAKSSVEEKES